MVGVFTPWKSAKNFIFFIYSLIYCLIDCHDRQGSQQTFSVKGWAVDLLGFVGLQVPVKTTQLHSCIMKVAISSVAQPCPTLRHHGLQHTRLPCPSPTPGAYSNSCPSHRWCHPTISYSVIPFSSHLQSFPASGSFPMSQFLASWIIPKWKGMAVLL